MSRAGSIKRDKSGRWAFVVDLAPPGAARRQVRRRGFATKDAAQDALDDLKRQVYTAGTVAPARVTVEEFLTDWLEAIKPTVKPATWERYGRDVRVHIKPRIGSHRLASVDAGTLNRLYAELSESGRADQQKGTGLSPRSVRHVHTVLHRAFRDAVRWGRLGRNPADAADPPSTATARDAAPEFQTWTSDQLAGFLQRMAGDRYHAPFLFLATTGMRRGEALGLRWSDLDLENGRASIRQTITAIKHQVTMSPSTKTGKGRSVDLDRATCEALRAHRKDQAQERLLVGAGWQDNGLVFTLPDGRPYHPERFSREFVRRAERFGLPPIRLHDLRHTWATLALEAGVPLKVVSERLGHATTAVTADIYSHVTPSMGRNAAEQVAGMIFGPRPL